MCTILDKMQYVNKSFIAFSQSLTGCRIQEWNTYWLIRVKVLTLAEGEQSTHAFKESDRNSWVVTNKLERGMRVRKG